VTTFGRNLRSSS